MHACYKYKYTNTQKQMHKYTNTNSQKHKYTNTAYDKMTEIPNVCYIYFWTAGGPKM